MDDSAVHTLNRIWRCREFAASIQADSDSTTSCPAPRPSTRLSSSLLFATMIPFETLIPYGIIVAVCAPFRSNRFRFS